MAIYDDQNEELNNGLMNQVDEEFDADKFGQQAVAKSIAQQNARPDLVQQPMVSEDAMKMPAVEEAHKTKQDTYQSLLGDYQKLQQDRAQQQNLLGFLAAGGQIGQAIAGGTSGQTKFDTSALDNLSKMADRPVQDYTDRIKQQGQDIELKSAMEDRSPSSIKSQKAREFFATRGMQVDPNASYADLMQLKKAGDPLDTQLDQQKLAHGETSLQDEKQMRNPGSTISQYYRMMAKKQGIPVTDDMSAWDLAAMLKLQKEQKAGRASQQSQYLSIDTGNPLTFDPETNQYRDSLTGAKPSGVVRNILSKDAFGNSNYMAGPNQAPIKALNSQYGETDGKKLDLQYDELKKSGKEFQPNKEQRVALTDEKTRLDKVLEASSKQLSAANSVLAVLDGDSKLALSVVKARMPRVMGEVGNLNQNEQDMWQGSQAWLDKAEQFFSKIKTSELTADNKAELKKILVPFVQSANESTNFIKNSSSNSLTSYGIPPQYSKSNYGGVYIAPSVQTAIDSGGKDLVRVETIDGRFLRMPKENIDKAREQKLIK